jgi:methionyl-tRNA formyltransferase
LDARLRIVFFGTPAFAVPTLTRLLDSRHQVVGVVTQPDRPRGRGQRMSPSPVKELAFDRGLPLLQPDRLRRDDFEEPFRALTPDLGVVAAYGKILPEWLLQLPAHGMVNVHASLLPKYRGAAPVHRAVLAGDTETGVTIMRVVKALDAGPMMGRVTRPIGIEESSDVVERDLAGLGADLLVTVVNDLAAGRAVEIPQNDAEATYASRLTKEEGAIDWSRPALALHNQVRGLRPWPAAYTFLNGQRLVIHQARVSRLETAGQPAGTCLTAAGGAITVACAEGALDILQIQPEGRRVMSARDFAAGHGRLQGVHFGGARI